MALQEVKRGNTLRDVSERYDIPKSTLGKYRKVRDINSVKIGAGRKTRLSTEDENSLAKYLYESGKYGFGLTRGEILQFVKEYCEEKGLNWVPGREWYEGFMKRHTQLSTRKGESMSSQRLRGADPFVIKHWYEQLDKIYKKEKITPLDGHRVYNCDETGFSHDPKDVKLVAPKGQKRVSKNIAGSGKKKHYRSSLWQCQWGKVTPFYYIQGKIRLAKLDSGQRLSWHSLHCPKQRLDGW